VTIRVPKYADTTDLRYLMFDPPSAVTPFREPFDMPFPPSLSHLSHLSLFREVGGYWDYWCGKHVKAVNRVFKAKETPCLKKHPVIGDKFLWTVPREEAIAHLRSLYSAEYRTSSLDPNVRFSSSVRMASMWYQ
jgi:hypothetical protein